MSEADILKRVEAAEQKADHAAEVALAAVATTQHLQAALEKGHAQQAEMLSAMRTMSALAGNLAKAVLGKGG